MMIKKGKWYSNGYILIYATSNEDEFRNFSGYGLNFKGDWEICLHWSSRFFTPAQDDYVIERMQEEVNKRYSVGDVVKSLFDGKEYALTQTYHETWEFDLLKRGELWGYDETKTLGVLLMEDGKWADKVEKEEQKEKEVPKRLTKQEFLQQFEDKGFKMFHEESIIKKLHRLEFLENLMKNNEVTLKPLSERRLLLDEITNL